MMGNQLNWRLCRDQDLPSWRKLNLRREYFKVGDEQDLFEFVDKFVNENNDLPNVETLKQKNFEEFPTPESAKFYYEQMRERFRHNTLKAVMENGSTLLKHDAVAVEDMFIKAGGNLMRPWDDIFSDEAEDEQPGKLDLSLFKLPVPWLNDLAGWIGEYSERPYVQFNTVASLGLVASLTHNSWAGVNHCSPSLGFMVLAGTGVGKNYLRKAIGQALYEIDGYHHLGPNRFTSPQAMYEAIVENNTMLCIQDEFGDLLARARSKGGSLEAETLSYMKDVLTSGMSRIPAKRFSQGGKVKKAGAEELPKFVDRPRLNLILLSNTDRVLENLDADSATGGFLGRLITLKIGGKEGRVAAKPMTCPMLPEALKDRLIKLRDSIGTVGITPEASDLQWSLGERIQTKVDEGAYRLPELYMRLRENALRLASVVAIASNPDEPVVDLTVMQWAITLVETLIGQMEKPLASHTFGSDMDRASEDVIKFLREAKSPQSLAWITSHTRALRKLELPKRTMLLTSLEEQGLIGKIKTSRAVKYRLM